MKDTLTKLRALISMKSYLIETVRADLEAAVAKIYVLQDANKALCNQNKWLINQLNTIKEEQRILLRDNQDLVKQQEEWWAQQDKDTSWIKAEVHLERLQQVCDHSCGYEPSDDGAGPGNCYTCGLEKENNHA